VGGEAGFDDLLGGQDPMLRRIEKDSDVRFLESDS
jgi:hypothetical protein